MPKLLVVGCSASNRKQVPAAYGDYLAEHLGYEYIHEAANCGSNDRMWRIATNYITEGTITSDDIVVVQYTESTRREFWSAETEDIWPKSNADVILRDTYNNNGTTARFKINAHRWQRNKIEKEFFELYESYFIDFAYDHNNWVHRHIQFQYLAKAYNIKLYFVSLGSYYPHSRLTPNGDPAGLEYTLIETYLPNLYNNPDAFHEPYNLSDEDRSHVNTAGHKKIAKEIYALIKDNNDA